MNKTLAEELDRLHAELYNEIEFYVVREGHSLKTCRAELTKTNSELLNKKVVRKSYFCDSYGCSKLSFYLE